MSRVRGVIVPESVILNKMVVPSQSKTRNGNEASEEGATGETGHVPNNVGSSQADVPTPIPTLSNTRHNDFDLPGYDARSFPRNGTSSPEKHSSPDYYYEHEDLYRVTSPSPRSKTVSPLVGQERFQDPNFVANVVGIQDVCGNKDLWKMLIAEFVGTLFLVLVGCGACIQGWTEGQKSSIVQIALSFGLAAAAVVQAVGHVSGSHINPAVTLGLVVCGKCSILKGFFYAAAQCLGGICGSAILQVITPSSVEGNLGLTTLNPELDAVQGVFVEALITFLLVLVICGLVDDGRKDIKGSPPLAIGFTITCCHLMAISYTGSSLNPARTLGPAVITKVWTYHWVYWCGPLLGGFVAGFLYSVAFQQRNPKK